MLVLGPVLARALSRLLGAPVSRARGVVGRLARDNAARSPRRTSATVLPLVIGLALIGVLTTIAADAMNLFKLSGADIPHIADLFAAALA